MVMTCSLLDLVVDTYDPSANMISTLRKVLQIKKSLTASINTDLIRK